MSDGVLALLRLQPQHRQQFRTFGGVEGVAGYCAYRLALLNVTEYFLLRADTREPAPFQNIVGAACTAYPGHPGTFFRLRVTNGQPATNTRAKHPSRSHPKSTPTTPCNKPVTTDSGRPAGGQARGGEERPGHQETVVAVNRRSADTRR